jgi:hypothetical protein
MRLTATAVLASSVMGGAKASRLGVLAGLGRNICSFWRIKEPASGKVCAHAEAPANIASKTPKQVVVRINSSVNSPDYA